MPESLDAFSEIREIRARVEGIEHTQEMLVRAHADEILAAIWTCIDEDEVLGDVFLLVDGKRTQQEIVAVLKQLGLAGASAPTVSRKLKTLNVELGLVKVSYRDSAGVVYVKSDLDRILHLTPKLAKRLADNRKAKAKTRRKK